MLIEVITVWYNEEFLGEFFLNHYRMFADRIHVLLDTDTTDGSLRLCSQYDNVGVVPLSFPDMMDAVIKQEHIHNLYNELDCDWVIIADCDEFVFATRDMFKSLDGTVATAHMFPVYRHRTDSDLDPALPVVFQRRHGADMKEGFNAAYIKPCIGRRDADLAWYLGCHHVISGKDVRYSKHKFIGAHWKMADPELAVARRLAGRSRQSKVNLQAGYQIQDHFITEEAIRKECEAHLDDPQLF